MGAKDRGTGPPAGPISPHQHPEAVPIARRNVIVLSLTTAAIAFVLRTWWPVLPLILRTRGASVFDVSLAWGAFGLAASIPQLWSGRLQDRYGRRPLVALPTFAAGIAYLLIAPPSPWLMTVGWLLLLNLSQGLQGQSFTVILAESVTARERSQAFSLFQLAIGVASVLGPAVGGFLLARIGTNPLIAATGVVAMLVGLARLRFLVETKPKMARPFAFRDVLRGRARLLLLISAAFQLAINFSMNGPFVALYLDHARHFTPSAVNYLFSFGMFPGVLASVSLGRIVQRMRAPRAMGWALVGHFLLLALWLLIPAPLLLDASFAVGFLLYQAASIAFGVVQSEVGMEGEIGPMLGAIGMVSGVLGSLGLPLGGIVAARFGTGAPFLLGGLLSLLAVAGLRRLAQGHPLGETAGAPSLEAAPRAGRPSAHPWPGRERPPSRGP